MEEKLLDGNCMKNKTSTHMYLKYKLNLPENYGENLDALWDILSTYDKNIIIVIENKDKILEFLGEYGKELIDLFKDLQKENPNIRLKIL